MNPLLPKNRRLLAALTLSVLAAAAIFAYVLMRPGQVSTAPKLVYVTVEGELIIPRDLQDRVVLVNFWATDCTVCLREMPKLVETHQKYRPLGLQTIAVAMQYDRPDRVLDYAQKHKLPFKVALDTQGEAARGFGGINGTPQTFVVDKQGRVVQRYVGEPDFAQLHRLLEQKLGEPA
jgi:peroxiredoxin